MQFDTVLFPLHGNRTVLIGYRYGNLPTDQNAGAFPADRHHVRLGENLGGAFLHKRIQLRIDIPIAAQGSQSLTEQVIGIVLIGIVPRITGKVSAIGAESGINVLPIAHRRLSEPETPRRRRIITPFDAQVPGPVFADFNYFRFDFHLYRLGDFQQVDDLFPISGGNFLRPHLLVFVGDASLENNSFADFGDLYVIYAEDSPDFVGNGHIIGSYFHHVTAPTIPTPNM